MLARRLTTILPAMTLAGAIETTRRHRVGGLTSDRTALVPTRPCRAPHHTISAVGRIGGDQVPRPGGGARPVSAGPHGGRTLRALSGSEAPVAVGGGRSMSGDPPYH
jgi:hypothetical protein